MEKNIEKNIYTHIHIYVSNNEKRKIIGKKIFASK